MRLSRYFIPITKEIPKEAEIVSHRLMLRAGMIRQQAAGIYSWLPLGVRVMARITAIIREEMAHAQANELLMPTVQPANLWRESGRYDDYGKEMLRIKDRHSREMIYGPTNEEMITDIFRASVHSYKQLPLNLYHIQWKFRDELRPRFGVMRSREFFMKDGYSFDINQEASRQSYYRMFVAYLRIFARLKLTTIPMVAETGPIGGDLSHEFIVLASTGESLVHCDNRLLQLPIPPAKYFGDLTSMVAPWMNYYAATDDTHDAQTFTTKVPMAQRITARGIEIGHTFNFATKYSQPMNATVSGSDGLEVPVHMGSYGIGISRLVGALIEVYHDDKGIIWPESVSPFDIGLINLKPTDAQVNAKAEELYATLQDSGFEVLYDDTGDNPGSKFATMDLIGLPQQVIVGPKGLAAGKVEIKQRSAGYRQDVAPENLSAALRSIRE